MSAIWGFISLEKDLNKRKKRIEECRNLMKLPYEECAIDRFEEKTFENGFFACGIQYFKGNSDKELLPIIDETKGIVFTGDVVLNGRHQLISEMKQASGYSELKPICDGELEDVPDGTLSYYAWRLWGESFVDHIQGLFAIAVYDINKGACKIFADHTGTRCIHYCACGSELFFSTLIKPILKVMPKECYGLNEKFIAGCESTSVPLMFVYPDLTAFENVYLIPRANYLDANTSGENGWKCFANEYWNPTKKEWLKNKKKYKNFTDTEFRKEFRDTFFECVKDAVDTDGKIAATLSSGLDSSSVVTVAAKVLQDDKKIYAYTSIPVKSFERKQDGYYITDETEGAKKVISGYTNIVHSSESCEGISAFTEMDKYTHRYEIPGKAYVNHIWMDYIAGKARENGCKVVLNGQFGNYTISNGNIIERFYQELYAGRFKEAKRQLAEFGKHYGVSRKKLIAMVADELILKLKFSLGITKEFDEVFDDTYVKEDLVKKYRVKEEVRRTFRKYGYSAANSADKMTGHMFNFNILHTQGLFDTKLSLYYGILFRDPTKDKRIIELSSLLPPSQFVNNGVERRLVREYLNDCIPDDIRMEVRHRGLQSADSDVRLRECGSEKMRSTLNLRLGRYMHIDKIKSLLSGNIETDNVFDIVRVLALNSFIDEYEKKES